MKARSFKFTSLNQLFNEPLPADEWLINRLIPKGGIIAISAPPASYKTWIVLEMVRAIAGGTPFLNHFDTQQVGVLYVDEENGKYELHKRALCLDFNRLLPIHFITLEVFKLETEQINELLEFAKENQIELIIFDSLVRIHNKNENEAAEMSQVFQQLKRFNKAGITIIFTHHHRKGSGSQNNPSNDMRGSSDILAQVDCHIIVKKQDEGLLLTQAKLRQNKELSPFAVEIIEIEEGGMKFDYGHEIDITQSKSEEAANSIFETLRTIGHPLSQKILLAELEASGCRAGVRTIRSVLAKMVEGNEIFVMRGNKSTKLYWVLSDFEYETESGKSYIPIEM